MKPNHSTHTNNQINPKQQQTEQNHDNCDDCIRQRAQNNVLIQLYEKLQQVNQKKNGLKKELQNHQANIQIKSEQINDFCNKIKPINSTNHIQQFAKIGLQLYADLIYIQKKSNLQKQNQRLRLILKNIHKQRQNGLNNNILPTMKSKSDEKVTNQYIFSQNKVEQRKSQMNEQKVLFSEAHEWFSDKKKKHSQDLRSSSMEKSFEVFSTKSTFNFTKRQSLNRKDFQELNLWLFEDKNEVLEKQLYDMNNQLNGSINLNLNTTQQRNYYQHKNIQYLNKMSNSINLSSEYSARKNFSYHKKIQSNLESSTTNKQSFTTNKFKLASIYENTRKPNIYKRSQDKSLSLYTKNPQNINPQIIYKQNVRQKQVRGSVLPAIYTK